MSKKITYHIPTEQYGFVEYMQEMENGDLIPMYETIKKEVLVSPHEGLSDKEFNTILDAYITHGNDMSATQYEGMNNEQQKIIQTLKRAFKRIKAKSVDTYQCKSYFDKDNNLQDCTCGECK